jgi:membrane protein implicated in regulation of membrane protease activity
MQFWGQNKHIIKLEWVHPEWLRALAILLIVAPVLAGTALVFGSLVLIVPLILLVKFVGISWALFIWVLLYGYVSLRIVRWMRRQQKNRPRRSRVMH